MKKILLSALCVLGIQAAKAQNENRVITTGVPFLLISADARAAGMADQGVATSADVFSQQWNPSKYAFALQEHGLSASYTPYLTSIANDISLGQVTYYNKFQDRMAFGASLRYFGLGDIELRQTADPDEPVVTRSPNELAVDLSYALKLSERFSMSVAGRFISSNLRIPEASGGSSDASAALSYAFDLSGFYQSEEEAYDSFDGRYRLGFNFQNLGPKISYDNDPNLSSNFLPSNFRLGGGFDFIFDEYNTIGVNVEFAKLLVPTPKSLVEAIDLNDNGDFTDPGDISREQATEQNQQNRNAYNDINWVSGIFKSFGDAPGGFSEELKEITYSVGAEYLYNNAFALRLGYFNENEQKGARKFFSLGAGFKYTVIKIDVSYLFSASTVRNPLENTLRFSLSFNFGDEYDEY
ncbi:type IX secretion system outer membrane channel protein PorV [Flavobacterium sp. Sd200]|uniref:type IX secretion system outer membrane channel protein PorV n=1 Tax=Flavobacterium sp. Sd200 TaxID=2692211 RepID=UPI00136C8ED4|nr:type IX secretion system outer membrane channel protein PorV [Flavobacterium sp. Sd200]MXN90892.1 type IX secretion system outer membrane channel protein PorV [Flavobacterium sp. Sd200]